jgi:integrase
MSLTARQVGTLKEPGRYGDGDGLWLQVSKSGSKAWLYRFMLNGKAREMGLGAVKDVTLADARELARAARREAKAGRDPIETRKAAKAQQALAANSSMTFTEAALAAIAAKEAGWQNAEHRRQWRATLETYALPIMGHLPPEAIDTGLVRKCLEPIWTTRRATAERVRGRIEAVLGWAAASRDDYRYVNPARWRGHLDHLLPKQAAPVAHHPALPYAAMPEFMAKLRTRSGISARALEFCILTAARTGEVIRARWSEIDGDTWTVPAARMKGRREQRVPLSSSVLAVLKLLPREGEFVFVGDRAGRPLHNRAMMELLRAMGVAAVVHGFRSTFRDWASETTAYPRDVCEMALAHAISSKVEAAYRRGDLFEKRARLMEDWAEFCATPAHAGAEIAPIRARQVVANEDSVSRRG